MVNKVYILELDEPYGYGPIVMGVFHSEFSAEEYAKAKKWKHYNI